MSKVNKHAVTIANGTTTSDALQLDDKLLVGIEFPAAFTGANVSLLVSQDGTNFVPLYAAGALVTLTVTSSTNTIERLVPADYAMARYIKVVSASSEGAARTVNLWVRSEDDD